ncbi:hypothetical protein SRABI118_01139 [Massilia sp. Bi118]|uniref:TPM domain-containing protein n=1 Tax=Massilia sp. Bi118 TaxID=2822346 RepID=UPI001E02B37C|nr:TPM domain-containing protein [Massilia sp. Bi118]CAH0177080.1 hypothetical protein SRABI118_01139 [Massilia sp. Bi118]
MNTELNIASVGWNRNEVPEGVKGWSWGPFLLNWIWAIGNRTWIGLLVVIPYVGPLVALWLGFKGRELAWKAREWESVEEFDRVQKKWSRWGVGLLVGTLTFTAVGAIGFILTHPSAQRKEAAVVAAPPAPVATSTAPVKEVTVQAASVAPVPHFSAHVNDSIDMLNATQVSELEALLTDYEARSRHQVAVLLVKSTFPEHIDEYSLRVANAWGLGRKNVNDGVLLVVAAENPRDLKRIRISVGSGLASALTEEKSLEIMRNVLAPKFSRHEFGEGLGAGVRAIVAALDEKDSPVTQNASQPLPQ